jgi:hypothetical protein
MAVKLVADSSDLTALVDIIRQLTKEVQEMKEEQKKTSDQIIEIHKHLMSDKVADDLDLSDDN